MSKSPGHQKMPDHQVKELHPKMLFRVLLNGQVIAESHDVIVVEEDDCPDRFYFPREDIKMDLLQRTDTSTKCPFKGTAHYYSIQMAGKTFPDAVWTYEDPFDEHNALKDRLAFYSDKIETLSIEPSAA